MQNKKIITDIIRTFVSLESILGSGTPDDIIHTMEELKLDYRGRDIFFEYESYGYDGGVEIRLAERRFETDVEYNRRMKVEEKQAAADSKAKLAKEAKERKEYERLKKKFGSSS